MGCLLFAVQFCAVGVFGTFVSEVGEYLCELLGAHVHGYRMVAGIPAQEPYGIVIYLYVGEVGDAIFAFGENAMTFCAVGLVQYLSFIAGCFQFCTPCLGEGIREGID
ncbi:MAG: hypothetical protein K0Q79_1686 [Flavipsychrobacter sp.]|nr:hypothetical protein [Flavipsychrobacter sp.]